MKKECKGHVLCVCVDDVLACCQCPDNDNDEDDFVVDYDEHHRTKTRGKKGCCFSVWFEEDDVSCFEMFQF